MFGLFSSGEEEKPGEASAKKKDWDIPPTDGI